MTLNDCAVVDKPFGGGIFMNMDTPTMNGPYLLRNRDGGERAAKYGSGSSMRDRDADELHIREQHPGRPFTAFDDDPEELHDFKKQRDRSHRGRKHDGHNHKHGLPWNTAADISARSLERLQCDREERWEHGLTNGETTTK
jgi:hypothetical protein